MSLEDPRPCSGLGVAGGPCVGPRGSSSYGLEQIPRPEFHVAVAPLWLLSVTSEVVEAQSPPGPSAPAGQQAAPVPQSSALHG